MKILMFYAPTFWFKTYQRVLDDVDDIDIEDEVRQAVVVFYQCEEEDVDRRSSVLSKLIKNIKWLCGKFKTKNVVLHSFGHLSVSKAPPEFTEELINSARERLANSGFRISETPFGYLNEWKIHVAGESLAKVFKDI
jgi:hypothetical protein